MRPHKTARAKVGTTDIGWEWASKMYWKVGWLSLWEHCLHAGSAVVENITVMPESASLGFSSSGIGTDVWYVRCRYCGYDNSCWRSSSRPPDSLHELFQNRTEADKITNLSNSRNGFSVPMETDGGQLAAVPVRSQTTKMAETKGAWHSSENTLFFQLRKKNFKVSLSCCFFVLTFTAPPDILFFPPTVRDKTNEINERSGINSVKIVSQVLDRCLCGFPL